MMWKHFGMSPKVAFPETCFLCFLQLWNIFVFCWLLVSYIFIPAPARLTIFSVLLSSLRKYFGKSSFELIYCENMCIFEYAQICVQILS